MLDDRQEDVRCTDFKIHDIYAKMRNDKEKMYLSRKYENLKLFESQHELGEPTTLRSGYDT